MFWIVTVFCDISISQGSVTMHLRRGGIFTAKSVGEGILKIGQQLAKLEAKM